MTIRCNVLALLACLGAACSSNSAVQRSREFLAEGYLLQAFGELDEARTLQLQDGGEVDAELEAEWQKMRFLYLLEQGRQEIYADREVRGIALLEEALEIRPGEAQASSLIERAKQKLAKREVATGTDLLLKNEFEAAVSSFRKAQGWKPGYAPAIEGEQKVQAAVSRLHGEAQKQFLEAIRKLPEFRYPEVGWHAQAALDRDPSRDDAAEVRQRAMRELAQKARERADTSRDAKNYGAALMEYRTARQLWDAMPGIGDDIAKMEREVKAASNTEQAQLQMQGDRFERATALLDEAFELSTLERTTINELRVQARRRMAMVAFHAARDLELQGLKQEALVAFEAIQKDWPEGLEDEQARIAALNIDITAAEAAYAAGDAAEQKGELAAALEQFQTARTYYAKYRDTAARIAAIQKKMAPPAADGAGSGG